MSGFIFKTVYVDHKTGPFILPFWISRACFLDFGGKLVAKIIKCGKLSYKAAKSDVNAAVIVVQTYRGQLFV